MVNLIRLGAKNIAIRKTARSALYNFLKCASDQTGMKKVLVPSFCCQSVYLAVELSGCKPVLVDVDQSNFSILFADVQSKLSIDTLAVIFPHIFGICATDSLDKWQALRDKYPNVVWIEDACQTSIQKSSLNIHLGCHFDVGLFSCDNSKPVQGAMGFVMQFTTSELIDNVFSNIDSYSKLNVDDYRISELKRFESSLFTSIISHKRLGFNSDKHIDLINNLAELYADNSPPIEYLYRKSTNSFNAAISNTNDLNNNYYRKLYCGLSTKHETHFNLHKIGINDLIWRYPIVFERVEDASIISNLLRSKGINCSNHYYSLSSIFGNEESTCLNSNNISNRIINLWLASEQEAETCVKEINEFYLQQ